MASKFRQIASIAPILKSAEVTAVLDEIGARVLAAASSDTNATYVASLDMHHFQSKDRVTVQVGAAPIIGMAVEAKRGTMARALGSTGG